MTYRALPAVALAAVLAAAPARALDMNGSLGGAYTRNTSTGNPALTAWDFAGQLALAAEPFEPGSTALFANANYGGIESASAGVSTRTNNWGGALGASALGLTAFPVSVSASRAWTDVTTGYVQGTTGSSVSTTLAGTVQARGQDAGLPNVSLTGTRSTSDNHTSGGEDVTQTQYALSTIVRQVLGSFDYLLQYDVGWSGGSLDPANYKNHSLLANVGTTISDNVAVLLNGQYFLRQPTVTSPLNPREESGSLTAQVTSSLASNLGNITTYTHVQSSIDIPGSPLMRQIGHSLSSTFTWGLPQGWSLSGTVSGSASDSDTPAGEVKATGEAIGAQALWNGKLSSTSLSFRAGGAVGGLQTQTGDSLAWGAGGGGSISRPLSGGVFGSLAYSGDYRTNLNAFEGSTLTQSLNGALIFRLPANATVQLDGTASAQRQESTTFGTGGSRTASGDVTFSMRRVSARVEAGVSDSLPSDLANPTGGAILPLSFNTHVRYAGASATFGIPLGLPAVLNFMYRTTDSERPGLARQHQSVAGADLTLRFGLWMLSATERMTWGDTLTGTTASGTMLYVRLTRVFGATF
ncbi:MAG TPA: hypothetical protein VLU43_00220 [Anaeromyxobacteraceae bacterium]|nr:hypothetical protein [Anaeromyxobacteraceae bacterium]